MNTAKKLTGLAIATTAATLFLTGCESMGGMGMGADTKSATVHCMGVNSCKGKTACGTAHNSCKGQNSCKGKGWLPMSKSECDAKGGSVS
ncbi:MAG TPA: hypothetical protein ENJ84_00785 [Gammaproteobacteria bacterium]|nr:hypothetical protein [Gammaproteobacteria bacterium]